MGSKAVHRSALCLTAAAGFLALTSINASSALKHGHDLQPVKTPLLSAPATPHGSIDFVQIDLNFDGFKDLAVVQKEEQTAKPSVIYFLYDLKQKRFTRTLALDKLYSPEFDARAKRIRTGWRDEGERRVSEIYGWSASSLKLLERKELNKKTQECVSIRYAWIEDAKWPLGQRAC